MFGNKKSWFFLLTSLVLFVGAALGVAYRLAFHGSFPKETTLAIPEMATPAPEPTAVPVSGQSLVFLTPAVNLGSQKNKVEHSFELENRGPGPVTITDVVPSCSCTAAQPDRKTLNPGDKCTVRVTVDLRGKRRGWHSYSLEVAYQDPKPKSSRAEFTVVNDPDVQVTPLELSLIQIGDDHPKGSIAIIDYREKSLEISSIAASSKRIQARITQKPQLYLPGWKYLLEVETSQEPFPAGSYHELVVVRTDHPDLAEIKIPVHLQKADRVRLAPPRLTLRRSADNPDELFAGKLFLSDTKGEGLEVESISSDSDRLTWRLEKKSSPGNQVVDVVLENRNERPSLSSFRAKLTIQVKKPCSQKFELPVSCWGQSEPGLSP